MRVRIRKTGLDIALDCFIYTALTLLALSTIYPFVNIIAKGFSGYIANTAGRVTFLPVDFQAHTFAKVIVSAKYTRALSNTSVIAFAGTCLSLLVTSMGAYALSKPWLLARRPLTVLFVFTMMFSGGLIPAYILIRTLGLLNSYFALFLPGAINVYNMLILKSSFESVPESLEESAKLDGASNLTVFLRIMLPVSLPSLAAVALFTAVGFWNDYFSAMLYITRDALKPLQIYLYEVVRNASDANIRQNADVSLAETDAVEAVVSCAILASTVPVLLVYPFLQKYFVKGIMVGSVKG